LRTEDEDAYREFVNARMGHLRRVAYLVCGDWHAAEDAVATALAKLYVHWRRMGSPDKIDAYVRTMVLRSVVDERRRPWAREQALAGQPLPEPPGSAERDTTADSVDRVVLRRALLTLPPGRRAVLVLRFYEGLSVEETAAVLGCSVGNVKSQTARGLAMLRDALPTGYRSL
jgi:RNA polymerase sigma-70 factor (sigma-E family)